MGGKMEKKIESLFSRMTSSISKMRKGNVSSPKQPSDNSPTNEFKKRSGTTNAGSTFENIFAANVAVNLITRNEPNDFHLTSNDPAFGNFDDVVFEVHSNPPQKFAIQLKYNNSGKTLNKTNLWSKKGFNLMKYFDEFEKLKNTDDYVFVLATNRSTAKGDDATIKKGDTLEVEHKDRKLRLTIEECEQIPIFADIDPRHKCFKLNLNGTNQEDELYGSFFKQFRVFTDHSNVEQMTRNICQVFENKLKSNQKAAKEYVEFIESWSKETKKSALDGKIVKHRVALCVFAPFIKPLRFIPEDYNEKTQKFKEAMSHFPVTFLSKAKHHNIENLWSDLGKNHKKEASSYHIVPGTAKELDDETCSKLLWLKGKCPLILSDNEAVRLSIELCTDKQFLLLTEEPDFNKLPFGAFRNLTDLKHLNVYKDITKSYTCSIQSKAAISLETLISVGKNVSDLITTNELLDMTKDAPMRIGEEAEQLPPSHITRTLSRNVIAYKHLLDITKKAVVVVSCVEDASKFRKLLNHPQTRDIDDFIATFKRLSHELQSSFHNFIFTCRNQCPQNEFDAICGKIEGDAVCHLFVNVADGVQWVRSNKTLAKATFTFQKGVVKESELFNEDDNGINVICGPPGMGKSTLFKSLKNQNLPTFWTVLIDTKQHARSLRTEHSNHDEEELKQYIFEYVCQEHVYKDFERRIFDVMTRHGRVLYLWDGLDENDESNVKIIANVVDKLSKSDTSKHWITSREHLRKYLEERFKVISRSMEQFDEDEQMKYISERLNRTHAETLIIYDRIKSRIERIRGTDLLGIPLQIYILTEMLKSNSGEDVLNNIISIIDLYDKFIEHKFDIYYKEKTEIGDVKIDTLKNVFNEDKHLQFEYYKKVSLQLYFGPEVVTKWNACVAVKDKDAIGFITNVGKDQRPEFFHNSLGEYFAALYLCEHQQNVSDIGDFYFETQYQNIRYFFDLNQSKGCDAHIAVLYKDYNLLASCSQEVLTKRNHSDASALQLAISWCSKYKCADFKSVGSDYVVEDITTLDNFEPEEQANEKILNHLLLNQDVVKIFDDMRKLLMSDDSICLVPLILLKSKISGRHLVTLLLLGVSFDYVDVLDCLGSTRIVDDLGRDLTHRAVHFGSLQTISKMLETVDQIHPSLLNVAVEQTHVKSGCRHCKIAALLIEKGTPLEVECLHNACRNGHFDAVKLLLESLPVDATDAENHTPLFHAYWNGHLEIAWFLLAKGANLEAATRNRDTLLHDAAEHGHYAIAELLVQRDAALDARDAELSTPLHHASLNGHHPIVQLLIDAGANVDALDKNQETPLHYAAWNGQSKSVQLLLSHGADIEAPDVEGTTPLQDACLNGDFETVQVLIDAGADVGGRDNNQETTLHYASWNGHCEIVKVLLAKDQTLLDAVTSIGSTALHEACLNGLTETARLLLDKGARVDIADVDAKTALQYACSSGHHETVTLLLDRGADIEAVQRGGCAALSSACQHGHLETAELLLDRGAEIDAADDEGETALHYACWAGFADIAILLIDRGARIDVLSKNNNTPLSYAYYNQKHETVKVLIEKGVQLGTVDNNKATLLLYACSFGYHDTVKQILAAPGHPQLDFADAAGQTALHGACGNGHYEIVKLLLENHAHLEIKDKEGRTALYHACSSGHYPTVKLLRDKGADLEAFDNNGDTPLHCACDHGHLEVVKYLLKQGVRLDVANKTDATPMDYAYERKHSDIVKLLLEKTAQLKREIRNQHELLLDACSNGHFENVDLLLKTGGKLDAKNDEGKTALHCAALNGHEDIVKLLLEKGASLEAEDKEGATALHDACLNGHLGIVQLFLANGGDIERMDVNKETPLLYAAWNGHCELVKFLIDQGAQFRVATIHGTTPVHYVCSNGHGDTLQLLIEQGVELQEANFDGKTPLYYAVKNGHYEIVKLLISHGVTT